ncbi:membrane protein YtfF [Escherichia coli]|uniref:Membrane protein YtfF n=1 Tax=Escherichia coli TaxID=562 RepID=A0A376ZKZ7_ECOLX|nr:membrane protein YtfF [Escherichia coli]
MISGVLYALLAGLMWGLIFVGPLIVPEYPAMLQSMGRYLALGLIALPIAWLGRVRLRQLARRDWLTALMLTMMGNLIYYFCLASAIQRTGAPVSTMIIGTLPVVIPVFANLLYSQRDGKLAWGKLAPALICIGIGLASVNIAELNHGLPDFDWARYTSGIVLALVSVVCWGVVCPAQRPLAAGKSRQTSDDVGNSAGAGHTAGFTYRLSRRLLLAEYANAGLLPTLWPPSAGVY